MLSRRVSVQVPPKYKETTTLFSKNKIPNYFRPFGPSGYTLNPKPESLNHLRQLPTIETHFEGSLTPLRIFGFRSQFKVNPKP